MAGFPRTRHALSETYDQMSTLETVPLWEIYHRLVSVEPTPSARPWCWRYADVRPVLLAAGTEITAAEAERRVMLLANPGLDRPSVTHTLVAGLQLVMPGEIAPCHRHTQAALRFVIEGDAGYTVVDGERCTMAPGDLILNPSWAWHDHANTGTAPLVWLDGLDVPMTNYFGATFAEGLAPEAGQDDGRQHQTRADDESMRLWSAGLAPVETPLGSTATDAELGREPDVRPAMNRYPYERARAALEVLHQAGKTDAWHGVRMRYANPTTGDDVMATLRAYLQRLPADFDGKPVRSTESRVICVAQGTGEAWIGDDHFTFAPHDVLVVPNWTHLRLCSATGAVLFSYSDAGALARLGLLREERLEGDGQ